MIGEIIAITICVGVVAGYIYLKPTYDKLFGANWRTR